MADVDREAAVVRANAAAIERAEAIAGGAYCDDPASLATIMLGLLDERDAEIERLRDALRDAAQAVADSDTGRAYTRGVRDCAAGKGIVRTRGPWRRPAETTEGYPGLTVIDNVVAGSILAGETRLALWAFSYDAIVRGWDVVEAEYGPAMTREGFASFVTGLLNSRGEVGRLLLAVANAERIERELADTAAGGYVPAWWDVPELRAPVVEQLRRCLETLED